MPNFFFIPENLDLQQLLLSSGYPEMLKHIDKFYYVISRISYHMLFNKKYYKASQKSAGLKGSAATPNYLNDQYVRLHSRFLKRILTHRLHQKILSILVNLNVIEIDKKYAPGVFSKGYRLSQNYRYSKNIKVSAIDQRFF